MERTHSTIRLYRRLLSSVVLLTLLFAASAKAQQKTTVSDSLSVISGTITGSLTITANQTFTTVDGFTILAGTKTTVSIGLAGHFSVDLPPTVLAAPAGSSYSVDYATNKARYHEVWTVPISASPVGLSAVRVLWPKDPTVSIPAAQFLPPPGCVSTEVLRWTSTVGWICAPDNTGSITFSLENPQPSDSGLFQWKPKNGLTLTRISCSTDSGTAAINLEVRSEASPNAAGTQILSTPLSCSPSTASTTSFSASSVPGSSPVALIVSSTSGAPIVVRVHAEYQLN
ncbi:MAG TPA: hypothetical protein VFB23_12465 [Candidatus Acidoferrales bacterium]|nr:hypothetical protein [Candidatus Acidoferrales bacterium]HZS71708.1 hypothetical protein [Candidatus Acidoferrum sp.]